MSRLRIIILLTVALATAIVLFAVNRDSVRAEFELAENSTAIRRVGSDEAFIRVTDLSDTVPPQFAHSMYQRFNNQQFHYISVSPDGKKIVFAAGEGDQWLGMIDVEQKYFKFMMFGVMTTFFDGGWSPDSKAYAHALFGPDRRLLITIMEPPKRDDPKPKTLNAWFKFCYGGEQFLNLGWGDPADTFYSFNVLDSVGNEIDVVHLPLHIDMSRPLKKQTTFPAPEGVMIDSQ